MPTLAFLLALAPFLSFLFYLGFLQRRVITNREVVPNSRGLPVLPDELYSEILSHWQAIPIPQSAYLNVPIDSRRHVTLLALSQTCRSLRSFFLQYAWERIEVFEGMWTPTGRLATEIELLRHASSADVKKKPLHAKFAKEIRRQFETVTVRNPELGQYVRYAYSSFFFFFGPQHLNALLQLCQHPICEFVPLDHHAPATRQDPFSSASCTHASNQPTGVSPLPNWGQFLALPANPDPLYPRFKYHV